MRFQDLFSKYIGYPIIIGHKDASNRNTWHLYKRFLKDQFKSDEEIHDYIVSKLKLLLTEAHENVPYYTELFNKIGFHPEDFDHPDQLKVIPPLTKDVIRERPDDLISRKYPKKKLHVNATGGSTGVPVRFYGNTECYDIRDAVMLLGDTMGGIWPGDRCAFLWGAAHDIKPITSFMGKLRSYARNYRYYNCFDLTVDNMRNYHSDLSRFRPKVIVGFSQALVRYAAFLTKNNIAPAYPDYSIIATAENLYPHQREFLEEVFHRKVFMRYASRDCGLMAMECDRHQGYHVMYQDTYLEPLEEIDDYNSIGVTKLFSYAMPFIRYEIGDLAIFTAKNCSCGRKGQNISEISGRLSDLLYFPNGTRTSSLFFPHLMKDFDITEFQVIQNKDYSVLIKYIPGSNFDSEELHLLEHNISAYTKDLPLKWEPVKAIDKTASGKLRPIISLVDAGPEL